MKRSVTTKPQPKPLTEAEVNDYYAIVNDALWDVRLGIPYEWTAEEKSLISRKQADESKIVAKMVREGKLPKRG